MEQLAWLVETKGHLCEGGGEEHALALTPGPAYLDGCPPGQTSAHSPCCNTATPSRLGQWDPGSAASPRSKASEEAWLSLAAVAVTGRELACNRRPSQRRAW